VHEAGFPSVVALMGSTLSKEQEEILTSSFSKAVLMLDGDDAGRGATEIAARLTHRMFVKVIDLPDGKQPDQLSSEEFKQILGSL
jgi:DNA primase